jgi:hypothetical protein
MRLIVTSVALASLLSVTACGGGGSEADDPTVAAPPAASNHAEPPSPMPVQPEADEPKTGAEVVAVLAAAGIPVKLTVDYDETTDPNKQLGRPNGYLDKVAFVDSRIAVADVADDAAGSVELGGGVELFASQEEAQKRADYIKSVTAGMPALTEYGYVKGGVLLRLSRQLTPTQAKEYEAALQG